MRSTTLKIFALAAALVAGGVLGHFVAPEQGSFAQVGPGGELADAFPPGALFYVGANLPGELIDRIPLTASAARVRGRKDLLDFEEYLGHLLHLNVLGPSTIKALLGVRAAAAVYPTTADGTMSVVIATRPTGAARVALPLLLARLGRSQGEWQGVKLYGLGRDPRVERRPVLAIVRGRLIFATRRELAQAAVEAAAGGASLGRDAEFSAAPAAAPDPAAFAYVWLRPSLLRGGWSDQPALRTALGTIAPSACVSYASIVQNRVVVRPVEPAVPFVLPGAVAELAGTYLSGAALKRLLPDLRREGVVDATWEDTVALLEGSEYVGVSCTGFAPVIHGTVSGPMLVGVVPTSDAARLHAVNHHLVSLALSRYFSSDSANMSFADETAPDGTLSYNVIGVFSPSTVARDGRAYTTIFKPVLDHDLSGLLRERPADFALSWRPDATRLATRDNLAISGPYLVMIFIDRADLSFKLGADGQFHGGLSLVF